MYLDYLYLAHFEGTCMVRLEPNYEFIPILSVQIRNLVQHPRAVVAVRRDNNFHCLMAQNLLYNQCCPASCLPCLCLCPRPDQD